MELPHKKGMKSYKGTAEKYMKEMQKEMKSGMKSKSGMMKKGKKC